MPTLILMRHAKSAWDDPELPDRDRPLNLRGRLAATLMGAWLAEAGLSPDRVAPSDARRARETWDHARRGAGAGPEAQPEPDLYMADPDTALAVLRRAPATAEQVLMIGHEPGTTAFLRRLHDGEATGGRARAFDKFPTAAIAVLDLRGPWAEVRFGAARFREFVVPKDLV